MKVLFVHNNYASNNSGEEHASQALADLLTQNGHEVEWYRRSSDVIESSFRMKIAAFFLGIYNPKAVKELRQKINAFQPDVIQVQNLYPFISPAILKMIRTLKIPLVMRCPNYRLFCPTGLHLDAKGTVCEKCLSGVRELNCVLKNCERNHFKSIGYALRNVVARTYWGIYKYVDAYIVQTVFQKQKFMANGLPAHKLYVVPGLTPKLEKVEVHHSPTLVAYIGRVSWEKGIVEFLEAARQLPQIPFRVIGSASEEFAALKQKAPTNVTWTGFLSGKALDAMYQASKIIVVPGKWFEGFPNVMTRAMKHGKPVIASRLGAMSSIIDHGKNGLLVPPGEVTALAAAINALYKDDSLCKTFGENAKQKAEHLYTTEKVYNGLLEAYNYAIKQHVI